MNPGATSTPSMRALRAALALALLAPAAAGLAAPDLVVPARVAFEGERPATLDLVLTNRQEIPLDITLSLESGIAAIAMEPPDPRISLDPGSSITLAVDVRVLGEAPATFDLMVVATASAQGEVSRTALLVAATWAPEPGISPAGAVVLATAGAVALLALLRRPLALGAALLYTRIRPRAALEQPTRRRVHDAIVRAPGIGYAELRRETGLGAGALEHHLRILATHRLVAEIREGARRSFAASGSPAPAPRLSAAQQRVLDALPLDGLTPGALAERLALTRQGASWQVHRLEARGLVERVLVEGEWRWRPTQAGGRKG